MLVLGGVTAIEKNLRRGRRLTRPLGIALVLAAVYVVAA
jgi:predicted metal-binding membrane protein